jgi:polysaccharide export outer membrane protein
MTTIKHTLSFALVSTLLMSGCAALPKSGPTKGQIEDQAKQEGGPPFQLIDIDQSVIEALRSQPAATFHTRFGDTGLPPEPRLSVGDTIGVTIWEAGGGTLFSSPAAAPTSTAAPTASGSRPVTIPDQVVPRDGSISVPFAGRIKVAGKTILQVQQEIENRLAGKAAEPQVIVTAGHSIANSVTVSGEVVSGARVPLSPNGDRLLDVIASAGGAKAAVYDTFVRLSRNGVTASIPYETLISNPAENIYVRPGDVLTLIKRSEAFDAMGALGRTAEIPFETEHLTLSHALAKAAGPLDDRADPAGIFLFREEPAQLVSAMGRPALPLTVASTVPVVYRLDMSQAKAFFLAKEFPVEDKDVIYVADARLAELQKFFALIGAITSPIITGAVVKQSAG